MFIQAVFHCFIIYSFSNPYFIIIYDVFDDFTSRNQIDLQFQNMLKIFVIALLTVVATCRNFYYIPLLSSYTTSFFQCWVDSGIRKIVLLLDASTPQINPRSLQNIMNARNAGMEVQAVYAPCRGRSIPNEYKFLNAQLGGIKLWLNPVSPNGMCSWAAYSTKDNCDWLQKYIQFFLDNGMSLGVSTWRSAWSGSFGGLEACPQISKLIEQFWWIPLAQQQDFQANFKNYKKVGGWTVPYAKFYQANAICGEYAYTNYYEQ